MVLTSPVTSGGMSNTVAYNGMVDGSLDNSPAFISTPRRRHALVAPERTPFINASGLVVSCSLHACITRVTNSRLFGDPGVMGSMPAASPAAAPFENSICVFIELTLPIVTLPNLCELHAPTVENPADDVHVGPNGQRV